MNILTTISLLLLVWATKHANAQVELPDVIIGDPNDASNDVVGAPISEKELEDSLDLDLVNLQTEEDPITTSGFFQGDIMVASEDQLYQILEGDSDGQNSAIRNPQKLWPNSAIPYVISATFSHLLSPAHPTSQERAVIARAMAEYRQSTCIRSCRGVPCAVGRSGGVQVVSLGYGCVQIGVVIHELMHAAGFWHEQSRPDRDSFVTINWSNIVPHLQYNFEKKTTAVTQDLGSHMTTIQSCTMAPMLSPSTDTNPTITPRQRAEPPSARETAFSALDIQGLNLLYKCSGKPVPPAACVDSHVVARDVWIKGLTAPAGRPRGNASEIHPMSMMCRKACNLCGAGGSCSNKNQHCQDWAKKGECQRNAAYMRQSCSKACGLC
ncbi:putative zinc metalloproteinase [Penaeus vannamei]|uniref:Metalloendopeptidase n=1 Tax=Penaeus vannamei TaxID=6689 RepID=A0A423TSY6_PENVA|nr:putative zinc metalloproteinase [Penaeus vannamei]